MRQAARTDTNHRAIVTALRTAGAQVLDLHGVGNNCPDLLVYSNAYGPIDGWWLMEIKSGNGKQTAGQRAFAIRWPVTVVRTPEQALDEIGMFRERRLVDKILRRRC